MEIKNCDSIEDVRNEIDKVDDKIVDLLIERSKYVKQAAKFKKSIEEVKSDKRVKNVLDRTRMKAIESGISPMMVEEVFKTLINEMVSYEIEEFQDRKAF